MRTLTIELALLGRSALILGIRARGEAVGKIDRLLHAGARVTVITPHTIDAAIEEAAAEGRIELLRRAPEERDAEGRAIVFLEPGDDDLSRRLFERARASGALVCTLDRPEVSTFINPAVVHVAGLTLSLSTGGRSPALAKRIREDLEALFGDARFDRFLSALSDLRAALPRGERGARVKEAVKGFAIEARLRFPPWFERGEEP
jgi:precorrin-2 dehydrogenase/sirohydrochlorin ferrochelatase